MARKIDGCIVKPAIMLVQRYMESNSRFAVLTVVLIGLPVETLLIIGAAVLDVVIVLVFLARRKGGAMDEGRECLCRGEPG